MPIYPDAASVARYLELLAATGRKVSAYKAAGVLAERLRSLRESDPDFRAAEDEALRLYGESLEKEAHRRGAEGWDEPVFFKGEECGAVRRHSDRMLELLLKKNVPEFREKVSVDAEVKGGVLLVGGPTAKLPTPAEWAAASNGDPPSPPG